MHVSALGPSPHMTILDSGSTGHYFSAQTNLPNQLPTQTPISVRVANQQVITSTHTAELPLRGLPKEARKVHIFPSLHTNLVGVTPLTQAGCEINFKNDTCTITCPGGDTIQCHATAQGLWALNMEELPAATAEVMGTAMPTIGTACTPADIVAFHHAAMFSPAISTLLTALTKGYIDSPTTRTHSGTPPQIYPGPGGNNNGAPRQQKEKCPVHSA
jgi:hypothetical protein